MSSWILLAVLAQFISAGVAVIDKYIVTSEKGVPLPFVYAFYSSLLTGVWVFVFLAELLPIPFFENIGLPSIFNITTPTFTVAALSLLAAYTFFIGLVSLYTALKSADASDVVPVVGAVSAIVSFGLGYFFLDARLTPHFLLGFVLLSLGTFLVSHLRFAWKTALNTIHGGIFFALHYVTMKGLFLETSFDNGFFWSRMAFFVVALTMLLVPGYLKKIHTHVKAPDRHNGLLVLGNKFLAGIASLLILKATALGSVEIVQALGGLQFVLILAFGLLFGHRTKMTYRERVAHPREMYHKVIFIAMISVGFCILFI